MNNNYVDAKNVKRTRKKKSWNFQKLSKGYGFIRIHKSYIVNLAKVLKIDGNKCVVSLDILLPVGRHYNKQVKKAYILYGKNIITMRL